MTTAPRTTPPLPGVGVTSLVGLTFFALATMAVALRSSPESVAFVWPANAVAVATLARWPGAATWRFLGAIAIANLLASAVSGQAIAVSIPATAGNLVEIALTAWLIRRRARPEVLPPTLTMSARAIGFSCLVGAPVGGLIASLAIHATTGAKSDELFAMWLMGDIAGYTLLLVPGLAIRRSDLVALRSPRILAEVSVYVLVLVLTAAVGWQIVRFPFVLIAVPATFIAVRNGLVRTALICFLTTLVLILTNRMHLWVLPARLGPGDIKSFWFPSASFTLFMVEIGLVADGYRAQAQRLEASERRVASALEFASTGFALTDLHGRIRLVNARLSAVLRQPREALLGRNWLDLLPAQEAGELLSRSRQLAHEGGGTFEMERAWPRPDGSLAWIQFRGSLLPDGLGGGEIVLQLDDVSARRVDEDRVRGAFMELTSIIDHVPAMLGYWDADLVNRFANPAYAAWFGGTPESIRGHGLRELLGERRWASVQKLVQAMYRMEPQTHEGRGLEVDGQPSYLFATYLPNAVDGVFQGFSVIVSDITPVKLVQEALADAKEQAEQASRQKSAFVANMSHEIRTPLNAILGAAWLMERHDLAPEQHKYLELIRTAGQSLLGLLNDVLDFSKIEAGKLEMVAAPFELESLTGTLASMMAATAGKKDLELVLRIEPDVPRQLVGDVMRLQQVLVNLVGNAIKFTAAGEVELAVERGQPLADPPMLRFTVRDTGIGMTPEQQEHVFAPFAQADASISRRFGGTGLGLAISRRLVEGMNGRILLQSELGEGTTFAVEVPLLVAPDAHALQMETPRAILHVLVVDDRPASGQAICRIAESWGWMPEAVHDAEAAWALIRQRQAHHKAFDLLIADKDMPGTDGATLLASLRADAWTRAWPTVLMMRASDWTEGGEDVAVPAADGLVGKPVTAAALADVVQAAFGSRQDAPPTRPPRRAASAGRDVLVGVTVMLVEDNPLNQIVARGVLEQSGATVEVHASGISALARLREGATFDAILMDIQMPEMDGFTAAKAIREELGLKLPIIALTAGVLPDERARCLAAGMDEFVAKPLDVPQLLMILAAVTGRGVLNAPRRARIPTSTHGVVESVFAPDDMLAALGANAERRQGFLRLVEAFIAQDVAPVAEARAAWRAGQTGGAAAQLHTLRGAIGTLGAVRFATVCRKLEQKIKQHPERVDTKQFDVLQDALAEALEAARAWFGEQVPTNAPLPPPLAAPPVDAWLNWLREQDFRACSTWSEVRPRMAGVLSEAELVTIDQAMQALDFGGVLAVVSARGLDSAEL